MAELSALVTMAPLHENAMPSTTARALDDTRRRFMTHFAGIGLGAGFHLKKPAKFNA